MCFLVVIDEGFLHTFVLFEVLVVLQGTELVLLPLISTTGAIDAVIAFFRNKIPPLVIGTFVSCDAVVMYSVLSYVILRTTAPVMVQT